MKTHILYMYHKLGDIPTKYDKNVFGISSTPLVAILDSDDPFELTRRQKVRKYNLRPFEIQQNLIDNTIIQSLSNDTRILSIEFDFQIDHDIESELFEAIEKMDYDLIVNLLEEIRSEGSDVSAISFLYNARQYRVSKYGVVEIDGNYEELINLTYNSPVALLTGIRNKIEGQSRY